MGNCNVPGRMQAWTTDDRITETGRPRDRDSTGKGKDVPRSSKKPPTNSFSGGVVLKGFVLNRESVIHEYTTVFLLDITLGSVCFVFWHTQSELK